jgi:hypothetical protein
MGGLLSIAAVLLGGVTAWHPTMWAGQPGKWIGRGARLRRAIGGAIPCRKGTKGVADRLEIEPCVTGAKRMSSTLPGVVS